MVAPISLSSLNFSYSYLKLLWVTAAFFLFLTIFYEFITVLWARLNIATNLSATSAP